MLQRVTTQHWPRRSSSWVCQRVASVPAPLSTLLQCRHCQLVTLSCQPSPSHLTAAAGRHLSPGVHQCHVLCEQFLHLATLCCERLSEFSRQPQVELDLRYTTAWQQTDSLSTGHHLEVQRWIKETGQHFNSKVKQWDCLNHEPLAVKPTIKVRS